MLFFMVGVPVLRHLNFFSFGFSIVVRILFLVAFVLILTTKMVAAQLHPLQQFEPYIHVYTLKVGDSATSVAEKFNITLKQLYQLNKFRNFENGFSHLQVGDELEVPILILHQEDKFLS
ncbi:putative invasin [Edwardsiella piscicida]|nr:LysM peptidoglycan-binding domain-containing protein [Edwardsiella anguillarum]GAJ66679.1 putative invasin [Edwardsiella piscicida]